MDKLAYKPDEAAQVASIGRSTVYELMASGELDSFKVGRTRLIPRASLVAFLERQAAKQASA